MKMYPNVQDIQQYILNNKLIVAEAVVKGKKKYKNIHIFLSEGEAYLIHVDNFLNIYHSCE